jgi:hypothetical protein
MTISRNNRFLAERPGIATRKNCLECCHGSAAEVQHCSSKGCPTWANRLGRKPTQEILAEGGDTKMYPLEDAMTVAEFFKRGGTFLKAIKRFCLDCSGGTKSAVRNCSHTDCRFHRFRFGKNPNRKMTTEQREIVAARLKANVRKVRQ